VQACPAQCPSDQVGDRVGERLVDRCPHPSMVWSHDQVIVGERIELV
jgi:hypothetical protein